VAEIGAAFLCADLGITPDIREDHAAYIESWLKALKNDKKLIFTAAAHATRAVEFLKGLQPGIVPEAKPENRPQILPIAARQPLYVSQPMQIGQHMWRMAIDRGDRGGIITRYEYQDESKAFWHSERDWYAYNINDTYLGLPRGLSKLYAREKPALIKYGLAKPPAPSAQFDLAF